MVKRLLVTGALLLCLGCSNNIPMSVIMRNPDTGQCIYISHYSVGYGTAGLASALVAVKQQRNAVQAARTMGYTEMRNIDGSIVK